MLRVRLPRRTLFAAAAAAAVVVTDGKDKLPIYPIPEAEIVLQETPSELEQRIGEARRAVTATYLNAYDSVQEVVSKWIGIEQSVERRVKSLLAPEEQLTPAVLYIGVATLTGSVLARGRALPLRLLLPPTLFVTSSYHFLPKTSANVSDYLSDLEDHYAPTLAEKHRIANAHTAMTWERIKETASNSREGFESGLSSVVDQVQTITGLKLREALSNTRAQTSQAAHSAEVKAVEAVHDAKQKVEEVAHHAEKQIEEVAHAVEQKVQELTTRSAPPPDAAPVAETKTEAAQEAGVAENAVVEEQKTAEVKRLV